MGCDIHLFVEARRNGKWESVDAWEVDGDYDPPAKKVPHDKRLYTGRNYNLFAILADVRNGRGFAGIKTGDGFNPICDPKGLPEDVSPEVKAESDAWDEDGHSHSWHTLADLLSYDWTQTAKLCGWVDALNYRSWRNFRRNRNEGPEEYSGGVSGSMVKHIPAAAMELAVATIEEREGNYNAINEAIKKELPHTYTQLEWKIPYYKCASEFFGTVIPQLLRLGKQEDVRIVFWFDN